MAPLTRDEEQAFNVQNANPIWHYTTQRGFLGILHTRELWASHLSYLNDAQEFRYALDLWESALESRLQAGSLSHAMAATVAASFRAAHGPSSEAGPYVISFSMRENDLSQWRAYSGAEVGYALGFDRDRFPNELTSAWPMELQGCSYNEDAHRQQLMKICDALVKRLPPSCHASDVEAVRATSAAWHAFTQIAPTFKQEAFDGESEIRLISQRSAIGPETKRGVRAAGSFLVPYLALPLRSLLDLGLDEVVVGPCAHPELAVAGAQAALRLNGVSHDVRVRPCGLSYRNV